jgi:hypothetical protein
MLRDLLDWHRSTLLFKCAGLSGEQLAQAPIAQSNLSLLGQDRAVAAGHSVEPAGWQAVFDDVMDRVAGCDAAVAADRALGCRRRARRRA